MKKTLVFALGILAGTFIGVLLSRSGVGSNSGSEFWGDKYIDVLKGSGKGFGTNSGSKFFSDVYIKEKFGNDKKPAE